MDIEKAKEQLRNTVKQCHNSKECWENEFCSDCYVEVEDIFAIETVLSELDKKDKIINAMAVFIDRNGIYMGMKCRDDVIEHFTNKVEKDENNERGGINECI